MSNHKGCEFTMIGATTSRASAARRNWQRWTPALGLGVVMLAATACSSAGATSTPSAAGSSSPAPASSQAAFPGAFGTAAAVSGSSLEVQNPTSGQVTVTFTSATTITQEVTATSKDVTVGSCVTVADQSSSTGGAANSVTATTVTISAAVNGRCNAAGGFGGQGGFGGGGPRGSFSPNPSFSPRPRPSGSGGTFGGFRGANGKVTSVSGSGFVVLSRRPAAGANPAASASPAAGTDTSVTVTTTSTTKYLKVVSAHASALKVGECIAAVGTTNSIGAVAARTIRISQPGPNGCVTGFGRRGGFGSPSSGAAGNA